MPRASFTSSKSYVRRSRRKGANRIALPSRTSSGKCNRINFFFFFNTHICCCFILYQCICVFVCTNRDGLSFFIIYILCWHFFFLFMVCSFVCLELVVQGIRCSCLQKKRKEKKKNNIHKSNALCPNKSMVLIFSCMQ